MNVWQLSMAASLVCSGLLALVIWRRSMRRIRGFEQHIPPHQYLAIRHSYTVALLPAGEAWILWMGNFWG